MSLMYPTTIPVQRSLGLTGSRSYRSDMEEGWQSSSSPVSLLMPFTNWCPHLGGSWGVPTSRHWILSSPRASISAWCQGLQFPPTDDGKWSVHPTVLFWQISGYGFLNQKKLIMLQYQPTTNLHAQLDQRFTCHCQHTALPDCAPGHLYSGTRPMKHCNRGCRGRG